MDELAKKAYADTRKIGAISIERMREGNGLGDLKKTFFKGGAKKDRRESGLVLVSVDPGKHQFLTVLVAYFRDALDEHPMFSDSVVVGGQDFRDTCAEKEQEEYEKERRKKNKAYRDACHSTRRLKTAHGETLREFLAQELSTFLTLFEESDLDARVNQKEQRRRLRISTLKGIVKDVKKKVKAMREMARDECGVEGVVPAVVIAGGANWGAKKSTKLPKKTFYRLLAHEIAVSVQTEPGTSTRDHFLEVLGKKFKSRTLTQTEYSSFIEWEENEIAEMEMEMEMEEKKKKGKKGKTSVSKNKRGNATTQSVSKYTASALCLALRRVNLAMMKKCLDTGDFRIEVSTMNAPDGTKREVAIAHDFSGAWGIMKKGKSLLCTGKTPTYLGRDKEESDGTASKGCTTTSTSSSSTARTTQPNKRTKKKCTTQPNKRTKKK